MGTIIRGWRGMLGGAGLLASGLIAGCESTSPRSQGVGSPSAPMVSRGTTTPAPAQPWNTQPSYASTTRPMGTGTAMGSMTQTGSMGGMTSTGSMGMTASPATGMGTTLPGSSGMPTMNSPAGYGTPATGTTGSTLPPVSSLPTNSGMSQTGYATAQPTRLGAAPTSYQTGGYEQQTSAGAAMPSVPQPPSMMNSSASSAPALPGAAGMPTMGNGR